MKKNITATVCIHRDDEGLDIQIIDNAPSASEAKTRLIEILPESVPVHKKQDIAKMFVERLRDTAGKGNFTYKSTQIHVDIAFSIYEEPYEVDDADLISVLERYCNSMPSRSKYDALAKKLTESMHRAVQQELYALVSAIIRASATAPYDIRNEKATRRYEKLAAFMDKEGL